MLPNSHQTADAYSRGQGRVLAFFVVPLLIGTMAIMVLFSPPKPSKVKEASTPAPAGQALFETNCSNNGGEITYNLDGNTVDRTMSMTITCKLPEKSNGFEKPQD